MSADAPQPQLLKLPRRFVDDHIDRELPTPEIVRQTQRHVWVRADDPWLPELLNDADFYADSVGLDRDALPISLAARALLRAVQRQGIDWRRLASQVPDYRY